MRQMHIVEKLLLTIFLLIQVAWEDITIDSKDLKTKQNKRQSGRNCSCMVLLDEDVPVKHNYIKLRK